MTPNNSCNHSQGFLNGLVLGSFCGAGAYYLLATSNGAKVKTSILSQSEKWLSKLCATIDEVKKETEQIAKKAHQQKQTNDKLQKTQIEIESIEKSAKLVKLSDSAPQSSQTSYKPKKTTKSFKKSGHKLTR